MSKKERVRKRVLALIAHDGKKADMVGYAIAHEKILKAYSLIGTGTTSRLVKEKAGLEMEGLLSGPMGGDAQIAARVADGRCDAVVFLRDPLDKHPHDPDINMLMRVCDVHNVPLATNLATADLMISGMVLSRNTTE
jgi:methylglyoxal synthase